MGRKYQGNARRWTTVVHNDDTLSMLNELAEKFGNRNAVLNEALDIGVPLLYEKYFSGKVKAEKEQAEKRAARDRGVELEIAELRQTVDDLFIEMTVQETMLAGLFNVKALELDGKAPTSLALLDGTLCDLPKLVASIKDDLTTPHRNRRIGDGHDE